MSRRLLPDEVFPKSICMECGMECDVDEIVDDPFSPEPPQLWCWCSRCQVDTFHPPYRLVTAENNSQNPSQPA